MANKTVYPFGTQGTLPANIGIIDDLETGGADKALSAAQGKFLGIYLFRRDTPVSFGGITISSYSVGVTEWAGTRGTHMVIPVTPGDRYILEVTESSGTGGWYAFLTSSYVVPTSSTDPVPYVTGTERMKADTGVPVEITIPEGCAYLCLCPKDGNAKTATWEMTEFYYDYSGSINEVLNEVKAGTYTYLLEPLFGSLPQKCSLGTTKWYYIANKDPEHIAVPVTGISTIQLELTACDGSYSFYTFVTSSYSPPVSNNESIPFATGLYERSQINKNTPTTLAVPEDAAYLILTTRDGAGQNATWSIGKKTIITVDEAFREHCVHIDELGDMGVPGKLRIASWNVGNFSLGASGDPTITPSNFDTMRAKWRQAINNLGADVLCCCEYNTNFMDAQGGSDAVTARDAVFTDDVLAYAKIGPEVQNTYMQTAIFGNIDLESSQIITFAHHAQPNKYYQVSTAHLNGLLVKIVAVHLDYGTSSAADDSGRVARRQQMEELITAFASDDYVIICGDFNVNYHYESDYDLFTAAGYKMVNHGYLGDIYTYPAGDSPSYALDNIVFKGFVANKIDILNDATLSDHAAIFADLTLIPAEGE